jgi:hypothetical protein
MRSGSMVRPVIASWSLLASFVSGRWPESVLTRHDNGLTSPTCGTQAAHREQRSRGRSSPARYTRSGTRGAPGCRRTPDRWSREVPRAFLLVRARLGVLRLVEHGQRHLGQIHDLHGEAAVISPVLSDPSPEPSDVTPGRSDVVSPFRYNHLSQRVLDCIVLRARCSRCEEIRNSAPTESPLAMQVTRPPAQPTPSARLRPAQVRPAAEL